MYWIFTSGYKGPMILGFQWKRKYHSTYYCKNVTRDEAENPDIQKSKSNYYMELEYDISTAEVMSYIDGMDALINEEVLS